MREDFKIYKNRSTLNLPNWRYNYERCIRINYC